MALFTVIAVWSSICAAASSQSDSPGFRCETPGYHRDPYNCAVFYRCVSFWSGAQLRPVTFTCKEPTVYDADLRVCQFPWRLRPPCVKNADGVWVRETQLPTVLPSVDVIPNITVLELGSPDYVTSPPPKYKVAADSPFACRGPGEYFADVADSCVFYYQCAETEPGVLNAQLFRCPEGQIFTKTSGGCVRPSPLPPCGEPQQGLLQGRGLPLPPVESRRDDDRDFYLELEFRK